MGVPAFYRWLSEKYPKIVQDVVEERVHLASDHGSVRMPFDITKPNPSGLEADNLYIDMNGIIHPCSHPENGPQPKNEQEMYENVCHYVDRLMRAVRPRKLLYLAIDGVAPRAKMNQQRSRRFRSAQEVREKEETEVEVRNSLEKQGLKVPPPSEKAWDSNVITPGTKFMIDLSEYIRFYIRKRIATDNAWKNIKVLFSDASIPGEGEHKIMAHVRHQRAQKGYNPNIVHVLHGLDADLIMLALATHEAHFYILREEVVFGRKSMEANEKRRAETGFTMQQKIFDEAAGSIAMELPENSNKPLQRLSIPILREYLANEFAQVMNPPFKSGASFERLIDDIVFMCFFVGNDFLPHLPSLDIRDGALDYLFNIYRRLLPGLGGYLTDDGGEVVLRRVDVILAEVGAIEEYVFEMKHNNEEREKKRKSFLRQKGMTGDKLPSGGIVNAPQENFQKMGRAARIMAEKEGAAVNRGMDSTNGDIKLQRGHSAKETLRKKLKSRTFSENNAKAAVDLKGELLANDPKHQKEALAGKRKQEVDEFGRKIKKDGSEAVTFVSKENNSAKKDKKEIKKNMEHMPEQGKKDGSKRKASEISADEEASAEPSDDEEDMFGLSSDSDSVGDPDLDDEETDEENEEDRAAADEAVKKLKEKVKAVESMKLEEYAKNVKDNVRLHEAGWKARYYSDKCKADDVRNHGGREHLFCSYIKGLCWVMKYYYNGCPSWKWYYPFHYAPFASDLRNIERFAKDCSAFELSEPFKPVEQLLAVLPEDSSHAVPKAARWLMGDDESPIIDFYPKDVPCDPNGKAMPWLWVVLLPFIDEERLLDALLPTMKKWSEKERLCNIRGLDDGYVFLHKDHPFSKGTKFILKSGAEYKKSKFSLKDKDVAKKSNFFGFLRKPLSHEMYDFDTNSIVPLPATACKISRTTDTFSVPIEPNEAICFAFSEPTLKSHKSIILPGAIPPPSILQEEDRRIRRPRLNRGGDTIANMGERNESHRIGYGSMNISSYERDLAMKTGRGKQMYQAGTRTWGSMEPTPKRRYVDSQQTTPKIPTVRWWQPVPPSQRMQYNRRSHQQQPPANSQRWQPPSIPQVVHPSHGSQQHSQRYNNSMHEQKSTHSANFGTYSHQNARNVAVNGYSQTAQQQWNGNMPYNAQSNLRYQHHQPYHHHNQQQTPGNVNGYQQQTQRQTGFVFNRQGQQRFPQHQQQHFQPSLSYSRQGEQQQNQQQSQPSGRANLSNLRAQLMNTLQQNRRNKGN